MHLGVSGTRNMKNKGYVLTFFSLLTQKKSQSTSKRWIEFQKLPSLSFPSPSDPLSSSTIPITHGSMDVPQLALSAFAEKCNSQKLDMPTMCESTNLLQQRVHEYPHVSQSIPDSVPIKQHLSSADLLQLNPFESTTQVCGMQGCNVYAGQDLLMQALASASSELSGEAPIGTLMNKDPLTENEPTHTTFVSKPSDERNAWKEKNAKLNPEASTEKPNVDVEPE